MDDRLQLAIEEERDRLAAEVEELRAELVDWKDKYAELVDAVLGFCNKANDVIVN